MKIISVAQCKTGLRVPCKICGSVVRNAVLAVLAELQSDVTSARKDLLQTYRSLLKAQKRFEAAKKRLTKYKAKVTRGKIT